MTPKSEHEEILAPAHGSGAPGAGEKTLGQILLEAGAAYAKAYPSIMVGCSPQQAAEQMARVYEVMAKAVVEEHERRKGDRDALLAAASGFRFGDCAAVQCDTPDGSTPWAVRQGREFVRANGSSVMTRDEAITLARDLAAKAGGT